MYYRKRRLAAALLALAVVLSCVPPGLAVSDTAATMRLTKTEGTVSVSNSSGKNISVIKNMRLHNGYQLESEEESYAWVDLDSAKLVKLDAVSQASIRKSGKKLEILLDSGNLFLNVSQPLEDDESLNIRTSTIVVGIRGTSAIVEVQDKSTVRVIMLEGRSELSVTDPVTGQVKTETVAGGESAICVVYPQDRAGDKCEIIREKTKEEDIRGFVLEELARNPELTQTIFQETGLDLRDVTREDAQKRLAEDQKLTRQQLAEIERAQSLQNTGVAASSFWARPAAVQSSGSSGGSGEYVKPDPNAVTLAAGASAAEIAEALAAYDTVTINGDYTLNESLLVPQGKTLNVTGSLTVGPERDAGTAAGNEAEILLTVYGTVTVGGNLINNYRGNIYVNSANTLAVRGALSNRGRFGVSAVGLARFYSVAEIGRITLSSGAQFFFTVCPIDPSAQSWPAGWAPVAAGGGDYVLRETSLSDPDAGTFTVTFDPNGGSWETESGTSTEPLVYTVAADTVLDFDPSSADYVGKKLNGTAKYEVYQAEITDPVVWTFNGWSDSEVVVNTPLGASGAKVTVDRDMTFYAQWHWEDSSNSGVHYFSGNHRDQLVVRGNGIIPDFDSPVQAGTGAAVRPWDTSYVKNIEVKEGITRIGDYAFSNSGYLEGDFSYSVTLPNGLNSIGDGAFECGYFSSIAIPEGVTSIGAGAFQDCVNLTEVNLPSTLTSIGSGAFEGCAILTDITIPEGVTSIGYGAFQACSSLTTVNLPTTLTTIEERTFDGCISLTGITLPESLTTIGTKAFYGCTSLTGITLPERLTKIGTRTFQGCTSLTGITFPEGLTEIGDQSFCGCTSLTGIALPNRVTQIGIGAFEDCTSLRSVTLPLGVEVIGQDAFKGCTSLSITYLGNSTEWLARASGSNIGSGAIEANTEIQCRDGKTLVAADNSGTNFTEKTTTP